MNLQQLFDWSVARHPDRAALDQVDGPTYSYRSLQSEARRLAGGMDELGRGNVAVFAPNGPEVVETFFGAWYVGRAVVPINARAGAGEAAYYLDDSGADVLVFDASLADVVDECRDAVGLDEYVQVGGAPRPWARSFESLRGDAVDPVTVGDDDVATVVYTSGTTGDPKGVPVTHESWVYRALVWILRDGVVEGDTVGLLLPLYHVIGINAVLASVQAGATVALPAGSDPEAILQAIDAKSITTAQGVPTLYHSIAGSDAVEAYDTSSLRRLETAGSILTPAVFRRVRETLCREFRNFYGTTEVMNIAYAREDEPTVGRASDFQEIRIVEVDAGDPTATVPPGERGEVIVRADAPEAFDGYLNKPDATAEAIRNGWYFTDDVGYIDGDGRLWLEGRVDDLVITGGENVSPSEVEDALLSHPSVVEVGVVGEPDEKWGERVVAYVSVQDDVDAEALDEHCKETAGLADFKRPREYHFVDELPKNPTGKVDRKRLEEPG